MKNVNTLFLLLFSSLPAFANEFAAIGAPFDIETSADIACDGDGVSGGACLAAFVESSGAFNNLSPFLGGIAAIGAPFDIKTSADIACDGDGVSGGACLAAFVESSGAFNNLSPFLGGIAAIGAPFDIKTSADIACGGDGVSGGACLAAFVESSGETEPWYPFMAGFDDIGAPGDVFVKMRKNDCLGTMDGYYVTGFDWFSTRTNFECVTDGANYVIPNDCQYIDMTLSTSNNIHSPTHPENWMCAILCDTGQVFTSVDVCATPCVTDGKTRRLHISGNGIEYSAPLYVEKLTTPAINFQIYDKTDGVHKMCYMNLRTIRDPSPRVTVQYNNNKYYSSY